MQRLPRIISFMLFLLLCATLAYWAIVFFSPAPRAVATSSPLVAPPAVAAAADLFGGKAGQNAKSAIQLRGVILAGRPEESVAILVPEGGKPKYLRAHTEVMPGVTVQQITAKKVVLSDHGVTEEVDLATFAASNTTNMMPAPAVVLPQATGNSNEAVVTQGSNSAGPGNTAVTASGGYQNNQNNQNNPARPAAPAHATGVPQVNQNPALPRQPQQPQQLQQSQQ